MRLETFIKPKPHEQIVMVLRRHWFTFVPELLLALVLFVIPVLLYQLIHTIFPTMFTAPGIYAFGVLGVSAYYLAVILFFLTNFCTWYLDLWIVTNDRIIDIEQKSLFSRTISELELFQIQDVTTDIHGIFPTIFNYGDVLIKTASTTASIVFISVPHANTVRTELIHLADKDRELNQHSQVKTPDL